MPFKNDITMTSYLKFFIIDLILILYPQNNININIGSLIQLMYLYFFVQFLIESKMERDLKTKRDSSSSNFFLEM